MLRLIGLAISIGLADSINPTTIAPALYLASGEDARHRATQFTAAVFLVYFLGGAIILLGPGELLLALVPKPSRHTRYILEVIAGAALLVAAAFVWVRRERLGKRRLPTIGPQKGSSALLGATITAVELPTAFPYFAVIAAIVGSGYDPARQLFLLLLFNICFVAPLLLIIAVLVVRGQQATEILARVRRWLESRWPPLLAGLLLIAGVFVVLLGASGLAGQKSRFSRIVHPIIHP
jgi:cytochrome c biogenesis protein CcdA